MIKKIGLITVVLVIMMGFTACSTRKVEETHPLDYESGTAKDEKEGVIVNAEPAVNDEIEDYESEDVTVDDANKDAIVDDGSEDAIEDDETETTDNEKVYDIVESEPGSNEIVITLYYANKEYITTGDATLDRVIPVNRSVKLGETPIEEFVVMELKKQPGDENLDTSLDGLNILTVDLVEKTAYVNVSSENLSGGSLTEILVLEQLIYSLTELDGVESVQILVDGSKQESLMGHIVIEDPLTRGDIQ